MVAFVTNNGYLDNVSFDGMRQTPRRLILMRSTYWIWEETFERIPSFPELRTMSFGIQVGVSINLLV